MARTTSCKFLLCFPLWLVCLVNCVSLSQGQVDCGVDDADQCELGFYCTSDYRCKKCAACDNFQPVKPCAKTLLECGVCRDGYEYVSVGKCAQPYNNVGTILLFLTTGCSAIVLLILVFSVALHYIRKKRTKSYSCSNGLGSEAGAVRNVAVAPSAPEHSPAPPPYTSHSPQPAFNSLYNGSCEPLLKSLVSAPEECQTEEHQMARPYSQYVRLPADSRNYDGVDEILNENVGVEDFVDNEDVINNNELPDSPSPSVHHSVSGVSLQVQAADSVADSLPLHDMTISTRVQEVFDTIGCMETFAARLDSVSDAERSRPSSPAAASTDATGGAQQVIVQFISNVSPILNLQGNNTRR